MRIRLKERCFFLGRIYEAGEEVILPKGVRGPHRAVRKGADTIDYGTNPPIDANHKPGEIEDVPLYDVVDEKLEPAQERHTDAQLETADKAAAESERRSTVAPVVKPAATPQQMPGEVRTKTHIEERS